MFAALANIFDESPGPEIKELESQLKQHPENHKLRNQLADKHLKLARDAIKHQSSRQVLLRAAAAADQYQLLVQKIPQDRNAACKYVESWMIIADYTDKDRRDLLEKILKQTLPVARQLAAKKDALPEDRQRLLEVLDKSIRLRRTQSQWGPALELAREAAQISRVALAQDQDQLALRVQLEAHLAVISDILIESKKP